MLNFLRMVFERMFDRLTNGEKFTWATVSIVGWFNSLNYLVINWTVLLSMCLGIVKAISTAVGIVVAIDFYKEKWKSKLFKKDTKAKDEIDEKEKNGNP